MQGSAGASHMHGKQSCRSTQRVKRRGTRCCALSVPHLDACIRLGQARAPRRAGAEAQRVHGGGLALPVAAALPY